MRSMTRPTPTWALPALAALLVAAPAASAASPIDEYQRSGTVTPCRYSAGQLNGSVPNDVEQYAPDFEAALRDAARAGCSSRNTNVRPNQTDDGGVPLDPDTGAPLPPGSSYVRKPPAPPAAPVTPAPPGGRAATPAAGAGVSLAGLDSERGTPIPIIALAILLLLGLIGGVLAGVARYMGWGLDWADPVRHAFGESGSRIGAALSNVGDRLRPGRAGPGS